MARPDPSFLPDALSITVLPTGLCGTTDVAARRRSPGPPVSTATKPLFAQLCEPGDGSCLTRPFLGQLEMARRGRLA